MIRDATLKSCNEALQKNSARVENEGSEHAFETRHRCLEETVGRIERRRTGVAGPADGRG
jgi:hypothetical protein